MDSVFVNIEMWLGEMGVWAYVVAPLIMAIVSILPVPAEAPAMANGLLFGPLVGTSISWVGALTGAWISYEIARSWGRPLVLHMAKPAAMTKVDRVAQGAGWWGLLVLRLVPVVAFTALNWGAGLCAVPRGRFLWTTAIGIIPGVIVFTSSGVGIGAIWRRSPTVTLALLTTLAAGSIAWVVHSRRGESRDMIAANEESSRGS